MPLTRQQLADRAIREAQIIRPGLAVDTAHALRLIPGALQDFSRLLADDPVRRHLTRKLFTLTLTNGEANLPSLAPAILTDRLEFADVFDPGDEAEPGSTRAQWPMVWKVRWRDLIGHLSPVRGYYALRDLSILVTRRRGTSSLVDLETVNVYANYLIDLSATYPCPEQAINDLITYLAQRLQPETSATSQPK